jgi:hypothetical protein
LNWNLNLIGIGIESTKAPDPNTKIQGIFEMNLVRNKFLVLFFLFFHVRHKFLVGTIKLKGVIGISSTCRRISWSRR